LGASDFSSDEWAHPEIEYVHADGPTPGSWTGLAAMATVWREFLSAWTEVRAEVEESLALDDERVVVLYDVIGRGKASGLQVGQMRAKATNLFHVRGGKVTRLVLYWDRERALAELDLAPHAADESRRGSRS
jgi:ketosteroid isomerase-like protein